MSLFIANGHGNGRWLLLHTNPTSHHRPQILFSALPRRALHIVSATNNKKKPSSSRTGRFDSENRRNSITTTTTTDPEDGREKRVAESVDVSSGSVVGTSGEVKEVGDGFVLPKLPGEEPDFWEGPQWEPLGFFVRYLWAFGVGFALIACGIAVATYNEGATDFKETPAYKESVQSRGLLEVPDESNADVFESNPTEVAPSLE